MEANGLGRSGPRRKTGCLTCRHRKVRCDEMKPLCAHCRRLRLPCQYRPVSSSVKGTSIVWSTRQEVEKPAVAAALCSTPDATVSPLSATVQPYTADVHSFETVLPTEGRTSAGGIHSAGQDSYGSGLPGPAFDINDFMGGITTELQLSLHRHETLTTGTSAVNHEPGASLLVELASQTNGANDNYGTARPHFSDTASHAVGFNENCTILASVSSNPPSLSLPTIAGQDELTVAVPSKAIYEEQLLQHFSHVSAPPVIFAPFDMEWKFVRPAILTLARESQMLMNAVCCYADIHKSRLEGKTWTAAPAYYRLASAEVQSSILMDDNTGDRALEAVFATTFLLMVSELVSTPALSRPGTSWLHSAYLLLKKFSHKTTSWRGLGHLMLSWISLLDVKSLIAGREGDPLEKLGDLSLSASTDEKVERKSTSPPDKQPSLSPAEKAIDGLFADPTFLIYDAIVGPALRFFINAQQIIRQIVRIDLHHRSRGTLTDEFEVLQIAHQVGADLEALWNSRPPVLDVYEQRPEQLFRTLAPSVAGEICAVFRQFVANFLTNFIYLHRVAFAIYPRTERVLGAVDRIIQLASIELEDSTTKSLRVLPCGYLWPLFIAGLEGSVSQRRWIMDQMRRMAMTGDVERNKDEDRDRNGDQRSETTVTAATLSPDLDQHHPNADKALLLLEEMTRRQDESKASADSKCVRKELFQDFFIII